MRELLRGDPVSRLLGVARERAIVNGGVVPQPRPGADDAAVRAALELAISAAKAISQQGPAVELSTEQQAALELFVLLVSRPSLFVRGGRIIDDPENWPEIRRDEALLPENIASVGRIEMAGGRKVGTGFLAGKQRILTNNHVVCGLLGEAPDFWLEQPDAYAARCEATATSWQPGAGSSPRFEQFGEVESNATAVVSIQRVVGHHAVFDLAVLELERDPVGARPLRLASAAPANFDSLRLYAVGYPVDDARTIWGKRVTPAHVFERIFGMDVATLGTKRFSPGTVLGWEDAVFLHDASTLQGSSGSCLIDFESRRVVGVHFRGSYGDRKNFAVPLFKLEDDPTLASSGVVFAGEG
ncbi:MAG TPA: serine protease [Polyangiales bacterium]|nr:serine protease [Polyangiales bacterium]